MNKLQATLGFNFPRSFSQKSHISKTNQVIFDLLKGLTSIRKHYIGYTARQIRTSSDARQESDELFHKLGPKLWPDIEEGDELPIWLLSPSDDPESHYPRQLYYSNICDREL